MRWLQRWKATGSLVKPVRAAESRQGDGRSGVEKAVGKARGVDARVPESRAAEGNRINEPVDRAAGMEVAQADLDWER